MSSWAAEVFRIRVCLQRQANPEDCFFVANEMSRRSAALRAHVVHGARARLVQNSLRLLCAVYDILLAKNVVVDEVAAAQALDLYVAHVAMYAGHGGTHVQKQHWCFEMLRRLSVTGNPRHSSCYPDETLNLVLSKIASTVHPRRFAISIILKWRILGMLEHGFV